MLKLLAVLGTILATGWFSPAHAAEGDWDSFSEKICKLAMYDPANRPACVQALREKNQADRNYLRTVQSTCLNMDIGPDTYGYGVFMNRTLDCYSDGLDLIKIGGSYQTELVNCRDGGDYGWIIRCFDSLIKKMTDENKGNAVDTRIVATDSTPVIVTSAEKNAKEPISYAEIEAKVNSTLNSYSKAHDPQMGATRSWSCEVTEKGVSACTVELDLPYNWCYSGHFRLVFAVDSKTGESNVSFYDWVAGN